MKRFTKDDVGCYADVANSQTHLRNNLASLLLECGLVPTHPLVLELEDKIDLESADFDSEYAAVDILNEHCTDDVYFSFVAGDLLLVEINEE